MLIPAITFVAVLLVVLGTYWLLLGRQEQESQRLLRRRLRAPAFAKAARSSLKKEAERLSAVPTLNALLLHRGALVEPLQRLIEQSGVRVTMGTILLGSGVLGLIGFLVFDRLTGFAALGLLSGALMATIPFVYLKMARSKRVAHFEELFPEAIDLITRAMRAGHAFTTGLAMVAEEMPQPIAGEFRLLYDRQNFGLAMEDALREFGQRIPLLDAKFFVTAVLTQRDAGGNLAEVLENLASVIRDRFKVRREVRTKSAHARLTGWILAGLPPTLAFLMFMISPDHMMLLFRDPLGIRMLVVAVSLQVIGTLIIRKLVRIEY